MAEKYRKERQEIDPPILFDATWYSGKYPDVSLTGFDPLSHYLTFGWKQGYQPHPLFDPTFYLKNQPDVEVAGLEPCLHYLQYGWKEGREPHPLFSGKWYLEGNPDVAAAKAQPLIHYLEHGWKENRFPNAHFDPRWYVAQYSEELEKGEDPLSHYATQGWRRGNKPHPLFDPIKYLEDNPDANEAEAGPLSHYLANPSCMAIEAIEVDKVLEEKFGPEFQPLPVYLVPGEEFRLNMVTDGIERNRLFGGVGTAIILSSLLAQRWKCPLRVITRMEKPVPANFGDVLEANGIRHEGRVDFIHADSSNPNSRVPITSQDVFLTTSHWTTHAVLESVPTDKIIYLLQEDERMFYPEGDQRLRAARIMAHEDLTTVINTRLLYDHLCSDGFGTVKKNGIWFEPSFPRALAGNVDSLDSLGGNKKMFLFYARPNDLRNLYYFGLELIRAAIHKGILDPLQWEFRFLGKDLTPVRFPEDVSPKLLSPMAWAEYRNLMRQMDLGLCLMSTPHPSYPPLDLASEGAVAVTNMYGNKKSLAQYSDNILCGELTLPEMLNALKAGVELASNKEQRRKNLAGDHFNRDWTESFSQTVEQLTRRFPGSVRPS